MAPSFVSNFINIKRLMKRITLKLIVVAVIVSLLWFLPHDSRLTNLILLSVLVFLLPLFFIFIYVVAVDLRFFHTKKSTQSDARSYLTVNYRNIEVSYLISLNGGGIVLAHEFVRIVSQKIGKVHHVFEFCSGPGFIGFSLLANNLCDKVTLADINPDAIEAIKETIRNNHLEDKVTVYQSDCLDSIPENEQWDLVVGNPPWDLSARNQKDIMVSDKNARIHQKFCQDIKKFLKPNGSILFVEGAEYAYVNQFKEIIERNGLKWINYFEPISLSRLFKNYKEYQGIKIPLFIFLRISSWAREVYFIWFGRNN
jgi:predicted RNA methylase